VLNVWVPSVKLGTLLMLTVFAVTDAPEAMVKAWPLATNAPVI